MDTSDHNGSLELEVSNFGPIVEAKVDLRPFTLCLSDRAIPESLISQS